MNQTRTDLTEPVRQNINRIWWLLLARGIFAIIFGLVAMIWTSTAAEALVIAFGIYTIADGLLLLYAAFRYRNEFDGFGWTLLQAGLSILAGIVLLILPRMLTFTVFGLMMIWGIVIWVVIAGVLGIRVSLAARKAGTSWVFGMVANALSIVLGLFLAIFTFTQPVQTALGFLWIVGLWALVFGLALAVWALVARNKVTNVANNIRVTRTTIVTDEQGNPLA